ncbi:MAG: MFS transporter [Smithella sp.]
MYFGNGKLSSMSVLSYLLPIIIGTPLVKPLVNKFEKKNLVSWPLLGAIVIYFLMLILPIKNPMIWIVLLVLANVFSFGSILIGWALVADVIDYSEYKTGRREEGSIYATYSFVRKVGQGVGQAIIPVLIALFIPGLVMKDPSTWSMEYATSIKSMTALFPLIGTIIMFIGFQFIYNLDNKKLAEIEAKLGRAGNSVDTNLDAVTKGNE